MQPVLYYVCGYQSHSDQSPKYAHFRHAFDQQITVQPLDYPGSHSVQACWDAFTATIEIHQPALFMGSSLGGFWALQLANHYGTPCILLNPCCHPSQLAANHVAPADVAVFQHDFAVLEQTPLHPDWARLVFLAKDDAVLDYREALRVLPPSTEFVLYPCGGHTFEPRLPEIEMQSRHFLQQQGFI